MTIFIKTADAFYSGVEMCDATKSDIEIQPVEKNPFLQSAT
jgi:hypothetical protein